MALILLLIALLLLLPGIFVGSLKLLLVIALVFFVASALTGYRGRY